MLKLLERFGLGDDAAVFILPRVEFNIGWVSLLTTLTGAAMGGGTCCTFGNVFGITGGTMLMGGDMPLMFVVSTETFGPTVGLDCGVENKTC